MRTLNEQNRGRYSLLARLGRDARLLARLAGMVFAYFTERWRIGHRYRRKERRGGVYWLDGTASGDPPTRG